MRVLFSNILVPYYLYRNVQVALANHNWLFFAYLLSALVVAGKHVVKAIIMHYDWICNTLHLTINTELNQYKCAQVSTWADSLSSHTPLFGSWPLDGKWENVLPVKPKMLNKSWDIYQKSTFAKYNLQDKWLACLIYSFHRFCGSVL